MASFVAGDVPTVAQWNELANAIIGQTSGGEPNKRLKLSSLDLSTPTAAQLFITGGSEVSLSAGTGFLLIGPQASQHIAIDTNKIQSKLNGTAVADLFLNPHGGNIGIGAIPTIESSLHFFKDIGTDFSAIKITNPKISGGISQTRSFVIGTDNTFSIQPGVYIGTSTPHPIHFVISGGSDVGRKMIISVAGKIGIATIVPTEFFDVDGNARFRLITSGASAGALHYTSTGVLTTNTSDRRLKKDIKNIENALDKVVALSGIYYKWKSVAGPARIGMIAQDVESVVPELVFTNVNDGYKGVHYDATVGLLVEAIKEQNETINNLMERVKILEEK